MDLNESYLAKNGIYIKKMPEQIEIFNLINKIRPVKTQFPLIRIGSSSDGGYLVPDDLGSIRACFSPGVDTNASFERDLFDNFQIQSHLADYSVEAPPKDFKPKSFIKKFIGGANSNNFITLESWINSAEPILQNDSENDLILQMDIEGAEYEVLLSATDEILSRFRIIILEFHYTESWGDPFFFKIASLAFEKLLKYFNVVHIHPNNCCGLVHFGNVEAPRVFELTLLRKDRSAVLGFANEFPNSLDRPNLEKINEIPLPPQWWDENIIQQFKFGLLNAGVTENDLNENFRIEYAPVPHQNKIDEIRRSYENSRSWKLTSPLRKLLNGLRQLKKKLVSVLGFLAKLNKKLSSFFFSKPQINIEKFKSTKLSTVPLITILGSCRQTSISKFYPVTSIRDDLNYPHYTKEIIQQIKYLKTNNLNTNLSKVCFRSSLLNSCSVEISEEKYNHLKSEFLKTDIFLVEVASRISYEWNDIYLHHIAEEDKYGFFDRKNIKRRLLSDLEIEDDLLTIREELYPAKFIIISHLSTYKRGARYELIKLLEGCCKNFNIPFLDQSEVLKGHDLYEIVIKEPVISHYTDLGNKIVGGLINREVQKLWVNKRQKFQIYYVDQERIDKYTFHGFGDFIKGSIYLYQECVKYGYEPLINFSHHIINNFMCCTSYASIKESKEAEYIFRYERDIHSYKYIFTNNAPLEPIDNDCKKFIIDSCLTPRIEFQKYLIDLKNKHNLRDYRVVHIRLKDDEVFCEIRAKKIIDTVNVIRDNFKGELLLLTSKDTYDLCILNSCSNMKTLGLQKGHLGLDGISHEATRDTLSEFMLLTTASMIYQLSTYGWGSGFSEMAHKLFDVELEKYSIE